MAMTYFESATKRTQLPNLGLGSNAFLADLVVSEDPDKTIAAGFFRMEQSDEPLVYHYR